MIQQRQNMRKIAANYIFLPGFSLVKNGYVVISEPGEVTVVDTGGRLTEIAGLEFYGGLLVPEYVRKHPDIFRAGKKLIPVLEQLYAEYGKHYDQVALIEGADLRELNWTVGSKLRRV